MKTNVDMEFSTREFGSHRVRKFLDNFILEKSTSCMTDQVR